MESKSNNPIFEQNTIEFLTVAVEYCAWLESEKTANFDDFVDRATKLLPLLYLKGSLLPETDPDADYDMEQPVTEEGYMAIREKIASILKHKDDYLETFHPDMPFSDAPVVASISESMADIYQAVGNFCIIYRQGYDKTMLKAIDSCSYLFRDYWGITLLSALKALHTIRYDADYLNQ